MSGPALTILAVVSTGTTTAVPLPGPPTITRPEPALTTAVVGHEFWAEAGMGAPATATALIAATAARLRNVFLMNSPSGVDVGSDIVSDIEQYPLSVPP